MTNETIVQQLLNKQRDLLLELEDLKSQLDAHLQMQLDLPTQDDVEELEKENEKLKKDNAKLLEALNNIRK